jgi:hypothetical protein
LPHLLIQFAYLQLLDFLTTLAFLVNGLAEANPVVAWLIEAAPTPLAGLMIAKLGALALGVTSWRLGRTRLLARMNLLFAAVVTWNLVALILAKLKTT